MSESARIIGAMREAVPAGRARLGAGETETLRKLTARLIAARPEAAGEYARFRAIAGRGLCLPEAELDRRLGGATVLVTGGTGCVGSALMGQLAARRPARLVSVSRGLTRGWPRQPGAAYRHADVTDAAAVRAVTAEIRPDVIFHVAAQRSPALAESEAHRTASVNVIGAANVLAAAVESGVPQVVCASTGKALRPYSPEIYTASKRAAEWVAATVAAGATAADAAATRDTAGGAGPLVSAARFTHVVDNSIVHDRIRAWAETGAAIRLHGAEISFYAQSAAESAQLLLIAMLGAVPGEFRVHAITDLSWPVSLLDVAIGVLKQAGSAAPLYISGYDPGYEEVPFPGLYDPATAGDVSPLLNAFEAAAATAAPCPMTDSFRLEMAPDPAAPKLLAALAEVCARPRDEGAARQAVDDLSWSLLDAALAAADAGALTRCAALVRRHEQEMSPVHRRITGAIRTHAGQP